MAATGIDPQTLGTANAILKEMYYEGWFEAFNSSTPLLKRLQRKTAPFSGKQFVFPIMAGRNFGFGARAETGAYTGTTPTGPYLPPPGHVDWRAGTLTPVQYWHGFKVTGTALKRAKQEGSMVDLLGQEMENMRSGLSTIINQDLYGSGNGALATITTGANSATQSVSTTKYLEINQPITFAKLSDGSSAATRYITAINEGAGTITVNSSIDTTAGGFAIFRQGTEGTTATATIGVDGLGRIFDTTLSYAGITDRNGTNAWFAPTVLDGSAGLSIDLMMKAVHECDRKAGGKPSIIITSFKQWRKYGMLQSPDRRFTGATITLDGGFGALVFTGGSAGQIPVVADHHCPDDRMYFLDESTFRILENSPMGFMDEDGQVLVRVGSGASAEYAFEARMNWIIQLACHAPIRNAVIVNLP